MSSKAVKGASKETRQVPFKIN